MRISKTTSIARATARIQQLCCLGLGGQAIMPTLLTHLHDLVPSYANNFIWSDENGQINNYWAENMEDLVPLLPTYLSEFSNTEREREIMFTFSESMRRPQVVVVMDEPYKVDRRTYYRHDYYNLMNRPVGYHHHMMVLIREGRRGLGAVVIHRGPGEMEFTHRDKPALAAIMPFIAHALTDPPDFEAPLTDSEDEGFLVVDLKGAIHYQSSQGQRLLYLATHPVISSRTVNHPKDDAMLPTGVIQLCNRLKDVFEGKTDTAEPPFWYHRNAWGGFVFRAFWLNHHDPEPAPLIGISIRYQQPQALKLLRNLEGLSLSRRQMQLCLYMASGLSYKQIAQRMDVRESTAIYHSRELYTKLDVHNRTELVNKLMAR